MTRAACVWGCRAGSLARAPCSVQPNDCSDDRGEAGVADDEVYTCGETEERDHADQVECAAAIWMEAVRGGVAERLGSAV